MSFYVFSEKLVVFIENSVFYRIYFLEEFYKVSFFVNEEREVEWWSDIFNVI